MAGNGNSEHYALRNKQQEQAIIYNLLSLHVLLLLLLHVLLHVRCKLTSYYMYIVHVYVHVHVHVTKVKVKVKTFYIYMYHDLCQ